MGAHALLTRFNVAAPDHWGLGPRHLDREWLTARLHLFEQVCAPSVAAQTVQQFEWIVFVAPETPPWVHRELHRITPRAILTPAESLVATREPTFVRAVLGAGEHLTSQLDSDDALARTYVERVQKHAQPGYLSLVNGAQIDIAAGWATRAVLRSNPFLTRLAENQTVLATEHHLVQPTVEMGGDPGWLQAIHGGNVRNRYADYSPMPLREVYEQFAISPIRESAMPFAIRRAKFSVWKARRAVGRTVRRSGG